jgi:radical SAM/Cys-rich protein
VESREHTSAVEPFSSTLERHGLALCRDQLETLQVNVGFHCNQSCRHCHLDAGPGRKKEMMSPGTMDEVVAYAGRERFSVIDVTGGATELLPGLATLVERLAPLTSRLMLRSNLTAVPEEGRASLIETCRRHGVVIIASFPSTSESQTDSQRGRGTWRQSIAALKELNRIGYGISGSGLELNLVANPSGAFLPADQCQLESKMRSDLERRWGVSFNNLFTFANVPLGRYREWLLRSGNYDMYLGKLAGRFNPSTVAGLMCRSLISVSWDGYLHDCDFNLAAGLILPQGRTHVSSAEEPAIGSPIAVGDHCYACTAGAGFT